MNKKKDKNYQEIYQAEKDKSGMGFELLQNDNWIDSAVTREKSQHSTNTFPKSEKTSVTTSENKKSQTGQSHNSDHSVVSYPVKIVGDDVTEKDYEDFFDAFRKESYEKIGSYLGETVKRVFDANTTPVRGQADEENVKTTKKSTANPVKFPRMNYMTGDVWKSITEKYDKKYLGFDLETAIRKMKDEETWRKRYREAQENGTVDALQREFNTLQKDITEAKRIREKYGVNYERESRDAFDKRIRDQYAARKRVVDFSDVAALEQAFNDIVEAERGNPNSEWFKRLESAWNSGDYDTYRNVEIEMQKQKDRIKYVIDNRNRTYGDDFFGQFGASYHEGQMIQDEGLAWNTYIKDPTILNKEYAEGVSDTLTYFRENNKATLDDDAMLPWISQNMAGGLPQWVNGNKAGVGGAIGVGGVAGLSTAAAGNPFAGIVAAKEGARIGWELAETEYNSNVIRGQVFKKMLDMGLDEKTAMSAANDEAFISAVIETLLNRVNLGSKEGTNLILDKLKKHGFNVLKNSGKGGLLESVSIANERRDSSGVLNLANNTAIAIGDIFEGNEDVKKRVRTAIEEEAKRSLLLPEMEVLIGK